MRKEILVKGISEDMLDSEETRLIALHDTLYPKGYNVLKGGQRHSGYKRRDGPLVTGPRSEATKDKISQGFAERRASILAKVADKEEASKVDEFLQRQRQVLARRRTKGRGVSSEDWKACAKERRAETWRLKREAKWEEMGLSEKQKVAKRKKVDQDAKARAAFEERHPGKRAAESKVYMGVHRKKWNDARPKLTGNLRANCQDKKES